MTAEEKQKLQKQIIDTQKSIDNLEKQIVKYKYPLTDKQKNEVNKLIESQKPLLRLLANLKAKSY